MALSPYAGPEDADLAAGVGLPAVREQGVRPAHRRVHRRAALQPEDDRPSRARPARDPQLRRQPEHPRAPVRGLSGALTETIEPDRRPGRRPRPSPAAALRTVLVISHRGRARRARRGGRLPVRGTPAARRAPPSRRRRRLRPGHVDPPPAGGHDGRLRARQLERPGVEAAGLRHRDVADGPGRRDAGLARQHWGVSRNTDRRWRGWPDMHHIGADGLMPGMATPAQMTRLQTLHGKALDILFLQLMIRHHQGGIPMARYAAQHASEPYVRDLAQKMYDNAVRRDRADGAATAAQARRHAAAASCRRSRRAAARLSGFAAPVAQGIEHRPPEAGAQVRILPGAPRRTPIFPGPPWVVSGPPPRACRGWVTVGQQQPPARSPSDRPPCPALSPNRCPFCPGTWQCTGRHSSAARCSVCYAAILLRWADALLALGTVLAPIARQLPNASQPKVAAPVGVALVGSGMRSHRTPSTRTRDAPQPAERQRGRASATLRRYHDAMTSSSHGSVAW